MIPTCRAGAGTIGFWVMHLPIRGFGLSCFVQPAGFPPVPQFVRVRIYRSALVVELPMNGQPFSFLPSTDGPFAAIKVASNFLPRI
jgi:hypothetical protein